MVASLDVQNTFDLKGYLAYLNSVEPKFMDALKKKYGNEVLDAISRV